MKKIILWFICITWIIIIIVLSSQNGTETAKTSGIITGFFVRLFFKEASDLQIYNFNLQLRLFAHYFLFFFLGIFLSWSTHYTFFRKINLYFLFGFSAVFSVCLSFIDEWRKQFIVGRHFSLDEAIINMSCAFLGVTVLYAITFFRKKLKQRKCAK